MSLPSYQRSIIAKRTFVALALLILCVSAAKRVLAVEPSSVEPNAADTEFFEEKIRPLFITHCQECHSAKETSGGLRVDSRAAFFAGSDQGQVIVPGKPDASLLLKAVGYQDQDLQMPPDGKLRDPQIADLREWIKRGAPWPGADEIVTAKKPAEMIFSEAHKSHWAFQPLRKNNPPPSEQQGNSKRNPLDLFLDEKLAATKIPAGEAADARTLIRRLNFDLTGLPPTPERIELFVRDHATDAKSAVAKLVLELLDQPQHGEHWARHWLDVARYADSNGSEVDNAMSNAWRYRDYVVRSLNADLPYDQFVREQVAGDLLPDPVLEATGFLMLGPKSLAELDKAKLRADVVDEQVDTVGRAFLAMTLGCARCHDHKFDPLPTADYYALAGIFQSTRTMNYDRRVASWTERPQGDAATQTKTAELVKRIAALRIERDALTSDKTEKPLLALAAGKEYLLIEAEHFTKGNVRNDTDNLGRGIGVVRTLMQYPDHIEYEIEVATAGEYQLELRYSAKESRPTELTINGNIVEMEAAAEVTGDWTPAKQHWQTQGTYQFRAGKNLLVLHRDGPVPLFDKLLLGKPRAKPYGPAVPITSAKPATESAAKKTIDGQIELAQQELEQSPSVLAPYDGAGQDAPIFVRGSPAIKGAVVPRGFLRIVGDLRTPKPSAKQSGRLELAQWLTQRDNPLTARVIVNRVWLWHFGQGLVRSPDNFGIRGELPSHPELLDWLAQWFMDNGWSLKKLHTLICTSDAYQRASSNSVNPLDPDNRLLAHFPQRRLAAEELRDAILAVSGQLDLTSGGSLMTVLNRTYANGGNAPPDVIKQLHYDSPRRSLYLPIIRSKLFDLFAAFDYPDPGMLTGQRTTTTVAPQALFLLNSPWVQAQAAALAKRVRADHDDDAARLNVVYTLLLSRAPSEAETKAALSFLEQETTAARKRKTTDSGSYAWTRLCHALLMSNEFLYLR